MPDIDTAAPHPVPAPEVLGCSRRGRAWVVTVGGDLGTRRLAPVRETFEEVLTADPKVIVIDARAVTSADTGMLDLLLQLNRQALLYLAAPSKPIRQVLETAGCDGGVLCASSLGEALDAVGA